MSFYANITRDDPNPIKRLIHRRRFEDAMNLVRDCGEPRTIIDYGGGDGAFCRQLAHQFPRCRIICFEPTDYLRAEAEKVLQEFPLAQVAESLEQLPKNEADLLFCMEVFEHLPDQQTTRSLDAIDSLLHPNGRAIIGVPVEVFFPAFFKGLFRMVRRYGDVDATLGNVLKASLGLPPRDRPVGEIAPGLPYHFRHMGFDYRRFAKRLSDQFSLLRTRGSPLTVLPPWMNNEVYFVLGKAARKTGA